MTSDAKPKTSKDPRPGETSPTDPPVYSEAPTPEEVEKSQEAGHK